MKSELPRLTVDVSEGHFSTLNDTARVLAAEEGFEGLARAEGRERTALRVLLATLASVEVVVRIHPPNTSTVPDHRHPDGYRDAAGADHVIAFDV